MSKTERALTSSETGDALDDLFDDDAFDTAFDDAIEEADRELEIDGRTNGADPVDDELADDDVADDAVIDELVDDDDAVEDADDADAAVDVDSDDETSVDVDELDVDELDVDELDVDELDVDATDDDDTVDDDLEADALLVDESTDDDDADVDAAADVDDDPPTVELPAPSVDADAEDDDDDDALPTIVQAIPDDDDLAARTTPVGDPELDEDVDDDSDDDDVSDQILEELRRADIDGPVVAFAPQDETTAARRRPKQAADYDPAPVPIPAKVPRVLGRKARVRKVTRVVRHVDPWSVFKIAIIAFFVLYIIVLTASVLLWNVANATGTVDNIERFFESFGWNSFEFNGGELYHAGWIAGLFGVIGLTGLAVLTATLFNLITDLVGGMRFTVLEEEVVETRTSPMRRFVVRRSEPEVPAVIRDSSGAMTREAVVDDTGANARPTR